MRRTFVIAVLLPGGLGLLCSQLLRDRPHRGVEAIYESVAAENRSGVAADIGATQAKDLVSGAPDQNQTPGGQDAAERNEIDNDRAVYARIDELLDLAMTDRPGVLMTILSELNNPEVRIRKAAIEASVQFGSRDAIPALREALATADDPVEKAEITRAVDFLELPSQSEMGSR